MTLKEVKTLRWGDAVIASGVDGYPALQKGTKGIFLGVRRTDRRLWVAVENQSTLSAWHWHYWNTPAHTKQGGV